jgi:hypothetical protein
MVLVWAMPLLPHLNDRERRQLCYRIQEAFSRPGCPDISVPVIRRVAELLWEQSAHGESDGVLVLRHERIHGYSMGNFFGQFPQYLSSPLNLFDHSLCWVDDIDGCSAWSCRATLKRFKLYSSGNEIRLHVSALPDCEDLSDTDTEGEERYGSEQDEQDEPVTRTLFLPNHPLRPFAYTEYILDDGSDSNDGWDAFDWLTPAPQQFRGRPVGGTRDPRCQ